MKRYRRARPSEIAIRVLAESFPGSTVEGSYTNKQMRKEPAMSLRDKLDINAETWRPNDSEKSPANPDHPKDIVGRIIDVEQYDTEFGPAPAFTILGDDDNVWRWVVVGEVAQKRVARLNPQMGDEIGVRYLGRVPSPTRKDTSYHDWRIVMEKGNGQQPLPLSDEPF